MGDKITTLENERQEIIQKKNRTSVFEYNILNHTLTRFQNVPSPYGASVYLENVPDSVVAEGRIHPDDAERFVQLYHQVDTSLTRLSDIFRVRDESGKYRYYQTVFKPAEIQDGKPVMAVGYSEELGEYLEEIELQLQEGKGESLLDQAPAALGIFHMKNDCISTEYVNKSYFEVLGGKHIEHSIATAESIFGRMHPADSSRLRKALIEAAEVRGTFEQDIRVMDEEEKFFRWFLIKGRIIEMLPNEVRFFICFTDISVQHALIEREQMMNANIKSLLRDRDISFSIDHVLKRLLRFFGADRVCLFEYGKEKNITWESYEVCRAGVSSHIDRLQKIPFQISEDFLDSYRRYGFHYVMDARNDAVMVGKPIHEYLVSLGVKSILSVPLGKADKPDGCLLISEPTMRIDDKDFLTTTAFYISYELTKRRLKSELLQMSYFDSLTGLHSRNAYRKYLEEHTGSSFECTGILFGDGNGLKYVNDNFGHLYGDGMIKKIANLLRKFFDDKDIYRISGDEFVIIEKNCSQEEFMKRAAALEEKMASDNNRILSCGYIWEERCSNLNESIAKAEHFMYINKQQYYARNPEQTSRHHKDSISFFMDNVKDSNFVFYLQPQYDVKKNRLYGAEALARKIEPDGKVVSPFEFIPALEKTGLIAQLDFFILESVCRYLERNHQLGIFQDIVISMNFSRVTMQESGFEEHVFEIVDHYSFDINLLEVEVTESASSISRKRMAELIRSLSEHGIKVALDDLGVEYSSLSMMTLEGVRAIKIDMSFIRAMNSDKKAGVLIRNVIRMAHELGLEALAEGIETKEQLLQLGEFECDYIQGYYYDKPMSVQEFEKKYQTDGKKIVGTSGNECNNIWQE